MTEQNVREKHKDILGHIEEKGYETTINIEDDGHITIWIHQKGRVINNKDYLFELSSKAWENLGIKWFTPNFRRFLLQTLEKI